MSGHALHEIAAYWDTSNHIYVDPGTGNTVQQNGLAYGLLDAASGTRKLPDGGLPMYVRATGSMTVTNAASVTILSLTTGQVAFFMPLTSTTWAGHVMSTNPTSVANVASMYTTLTSTQGFIPLPLTNFRAIASNDIAGTAGTPPGGILAGNSAPALKRVNAATDKALMIEWAASNSIEITTGFYYPPDMNLATDITVNLRAKMAAASVDTPTITVGYFGGIGDTDRGGATAALSTTLGTKTVTVSTPTTAHPNFASISLTPGTHATASNTVQIYEAYVTYTKKLLAS